MLARLQPGAVSPPADVEDRIVAAALARRPATVGATPSAHAVMSLDAARVRRRVRTRVAVLAAAIVAAAVVIGVIVQRGQSSPEVASGHFSLTTLQHRDIDALVRSPGARTGVFGSVPGRVVVAAGGKAAVYDLRGVQAVAIGLVSGGGTRILGPAPPTDGVIAFVVDHPDRVVAVTLVRDGHEIARGAQREVVARVRRRVSRTSPLSAHRARIMIARSASQSAWFVATSRRKPRVDSGAGSRNAASTVPFGARCVVRGDTEAFPASRIAARLFPERGRTAVADGVAWVRVRRRGAGRPSRLPRRAPPRPEPGAWRSRCPRPRRARSARRRSVPAPVRPPWVATP